MTEPVIRTTGLRKRYGSEEAVRGIDLRSGPATILGLAVAVRRFSWMPSSAAT